MWGDRYFGRRFFGDRFFGEGGAGAPPSTGEDYDLLLARRIVRR